MTASMTPQGFNNNCMPVPFPGSDLVNPRGFFPLRGLLMVCADSHHHGTQYVFSAYTLHSTFHIHPSCSHAFSLPHRRRLLLHTPSIYFSYLLFVGPGFPVSSIYILNLFFFSPLSFFHHFAYIQRHMRRYRPPLNDFRESSYSRTLLTNITF